MYQFRPKQLGKGYVFVDNSLGIILIVGACIVVLLVGAVKVKIEWLLNVVMRSILGTIAIYFINMALAWVGISLEVGINVYTILTSGILGIPGLIALYGIGIYRML